MTRENPRDHDVHTTRVQDHGGGSLCTTIVRIIADRTGIEPSDLEPLHFHVDTELIDRLCAGGPSISGEVEFDYHGYRVTITSDRQIVVAPITADPVLPETGRSKYAD